MKAFPRGLVLRACPQVASCGQGGVIANWRDLTAAAVTVRSMLGGQPAGLLGGLRSDGVGKMRSSRWPATLNRQDTLTRSATILVNAVHPGITDTEGASGMPNEQTAQVYMQQAIKRLARPLISRGR